MVGIKIQNVFDHMGRGMVDQALAELYSAVRITASGVYDSALDGDVQCRSFLHDRMEIILGTWLGTVAAPGLHIAPRKESEVCIPMEDILLDLLKTAADGKSPAVIWKNAGQMMIFRDEKLYSSLSLVWGIVLAVMTCPFNKDQRIGENCWLSTMTFKYLANDLWGEEKQVLRMLQMQTD